MVSAVRCSGTDPQRPGTRLRVPSGERALRRLLHQEDQNDAVPPSGKRPVRAVQPLNALSAAYAASGVQTQVARPSAGAGPGVQQHASRLDRLRTLLPALRTGDDMCVMIAFYTVFMIFMSDAICITRFMVCFH